VIRLTNACSLTPKPPFFCVTRCAQTLTQKHSGFGAAEAGVMRGIEKSALSVLGLW
jgi:hypothetical protein